MGRKEEFYILAGLLLTILSCVPAWLPPSQIQAIQAWLSELRQNPLFMPLVAISSIALLLLGFLFRYRISAFLRALQPRARVETRYLQALEKTYGKTPALLAGSESTTSSDLVLLEAFTPLTLGPDQDGGPVMADSLPDGTGEFATVSPSAPRPPRARSWRKVGSAERSSRRRLPSGMRMNALQQAPRGLGTQVVYWSLWAIAQTILIAVATGFVLWLLWLFTGSWQLDWWWIAGAVLVGGGLWLFAAFRLHVWLAAEDDLLGDLLNWWHDRRRCISDPGTLGAEIWEHTRLLIRGDPGCGKTTLMRHLAVICARQRGKLDGYTRATSVRTLYGWPDCPFPIYIPLRALDRYDDLYTAYSQKLHLLFGQELDNCDANFFRERLERGGCLVLLDAFDELRDEPARTLIARKITALPPGPKERPNRFVVTSRIVGYEGQLNTSFVRRRVKELDEDQAHQFVRVRYEAIWWSEKRSLTREPSWRSEQRAENLIRRMPNNPGLSRLRRNPLLLSLTVALHHNHRGRGLQLPEERYRLYEEALRILVRDWERRKDVDVNLEPTDDRSDLTLDERLRLLRELAWMMFELGANGTDSRAHLVVRGSQVRTKLTELLVQIPGFAPDKSGAARLAHAASEAERWQQNISQRGGVLQELGNVPGSNDVEIQFAHSTFQEYLAARAAAMEDGERRLARILERWDHPVWREVLLLYAASHDATAVIRHLQTQPGIDTILLAGVVLLERPTQLSLDLQERTLDQLRQLAFASTEAGEEQAREALRQLEERAVLPDQAALLHALRHAPHGPIRARVLELILGRPLIRVPREPVVHPALPDLLIPALLHTFEHDPHHLPRLAAGYALASADPRFRGNGWIPQLVHIPAGPFLMGSSSADPLAGSNEQPQHTLTLPDYWIGQTEVTNAQFRPFVEGDGYTNRSYWTADGWAWKEELRRTQPYYWDDARWNGDNQPVVGVSWFEAVAYCFWLSAQTGHPFRLPTEAEWEKAARGPTGRIWPWGNRWEAGRCNSDELGLGRTSPVGSFPNAGGDYHIYDMAGNVYEWCATARRKPYPYTVEEEWTAAYLERDESRVLRGGSWALEQKYARGAYRSSYYARGDYFNDDVGLRVASPSPYP